MASIAAHGAWPRIDLTTMTEYDPTFTFPVVFPPEPATGYIAEVLAAHGLTNLRLAETEKYAHVTYFFNGGREEPFQGEDRVLVPSPKVATYDLQPEMSAAGVADALIASDVAAKKHDVIICNFANPDMVGHTGSLEAAIAAVEDRRRAAWRASIPAILQAGGDRARHRRSRQRRADVGLHDELPATPRTPPTSLRTWSMPRRTTAPPPANCRRPHQPTAALWEMTADPCSAIDSALRPKPGTEDDPRRDGLGLRGR